MADRASCRNAHLPEDFGMELWGDRATKATDGAEVIPELDIREED